jgi:hypothetical protein
MLLPFSIIYGLLVKFVVIWYIFPVLTKKNLAALPWMPEKVVCFSVAKIAELLKTIVGSV